MLLAIGVVIPACTCGSESALVGESDPDNSGAVQPGDVGRWLSVGQGGGRTVVASYERSRGDLVVGELRGAGQPLRYRVVAGVPLGPITADPQGYRGGIEAAGPDVGGWPAVALRASQVVVAYQHREDRSLWLSAERDDGFESVLVDAPRSDSGRLGRHNSIAIGPDDSIWIAYQALDQDADGDPQVNSQLRVAHAPSAAGPWKLEVVTTAESADQGAARFGQCRWLLAITHRR